jgi:PIN domain nuclease of toxin-antitoxin system
VAVRALLDTHALLWWLFDDPQLSQKARSIIAAGRNRIFVSSASAWEISTKRRIGKLPEARDVVERLPSYIRKERFEILPISLEHALYAGKLPGPHRDPFDRMLIAQSELEKLPLVTCDPVFGEYSVTVAW